MQVELDPITLAQVKPLSPEPRAEGAGALHSCVGDVMEVAVELVSALPEPITLSDVQLRLTLVQESAGALP